MLGILAGLGKFSRPARLYFKNTDCLYYYVCLIKQTVKSCEGLAQFETFEPLHSYLQEFVFWGRKSQISL